MGLFVVDLDDPNEFAYYGCLTEGRSIMQLDFRVESRSYDQAIRGSWQAYRLDEDTLLSDENLTEVTGDCVRLWLPAGTLMHWTTQTRPLRYNCLQFFWPNRWYTFSAFYDGRALRHTYASIIQPARIEIERLSYVDLDLSVLVNADQTYEVLTQAEFEQLAELLHYSEETRISALMALRTITSSIQRSVGLFASVPHLLRQTDFHLSKCEKN
jgi:protein associated with RNAse G/E